MEIKEFFAAVFSSWVEAVGIILTLLPFIEKVPRVKTWLHDKPFLERYAWLLWIVGGFCIIYGFYNAWHNERGERIAADAKLQELTKPSFAATVNFIYYGYGDISESKKGTAAYLSVFLKNFGASSAAYSWRLSAKSPSVNIERASPILIPEGFTIHEPGSGKLIALFHENNRLEEKTMAAITRGVPVSGWLRFEFPGVNALEFGDSVKTLYFKDYTEREYSTSFTHMPTVAKPEWIPGSGDNPFVGLVKP